MTAALHRAERGFTLVELIVALTLVSLLVVMLFGGLRFGTRAANAVDTRTDRTAQLALVYDFMQNELSDARSLSNTTDSTTPQAADFDGEPDSLTFITIPPAYLALGGFHQLHLALQGNAAARRLVVTWQQVPRGAIPGAPTSLQPSVILDKVRSVEFGYFGVGDPNLPPQWQSQWVEHSDLPLLVRLRIAWADGAATPDLIVAPRLAGATQP
jgi:general secretion pathway protein J